MGLSSKERMLLAIKGQKADRLPVTTHHVMPYFLRKYMGNMSVLQFFDHFGLDPINWIYPIRVREGQYFRDFAGPLSWKMQFLCSEQWRIDWQEIFGQNYPTWRFTISTPKGDLTTVLQFNEYTMWVTEHLVKKKSDISLIGEYVTEPECDVDEVNKLAVEFGDKGLVRSHICGFDIFGQPGTWQDAACLYGIQKLIMETYDDPAWVHEFLRVIQKRKRRYISTLAGAAYDILELGGGDASSSVISPKLLDEFVVPYDRELVELAHRMGQLIVYHTCGGMMPILEKIAAMGVDAMETFTPVGMGGDTDMEEARRRLGPKMCMIGGFDQFHFFTECSEDQTRSEVRRCFEAAGKDGSFILCPSDHFFDVEPKLIAAFADEARKCIY